MYEIYSTEVADGVVIIHSDLTHAASPAKSAREARNRRTSFRFCLKETATELLVVGPKASPPTTAGGATDALVTGARGAVGAVRSRREPTIPVLLYRYCRSIAQVHACERPTGYIKYESLLRMTLNSTHESIPLDSMCAT